MSLALERELVFSLRAPLVLRQVGLLGDEGAVFLAANLDRPTEIQLVRDPVHSRGPHRLVNLVPENRDFSRCEAPILRSLELELAKLLLWSQLSQVQWLLPLVLLVLILDLGRELLGLLAIGRDWPEGSCLRLYLGLVDFALLQVEF